MALLNRVTEAGTVTPQRWPVEAVNGLLTAKRCGRIDGTARRTLTGFLWELPIGIDDETARRLWTKTADLAEHHRLSSYDTTCRELALRLGSLLATSDKLLITAPQLSPGEREQVVTSATSSLSMRCIATA